MEFYDGAQFPTVYHEQIFIAEHGSRNRTPPIGYRITLVDPEEESYEPFIDGRLQPGGDVLGRPVDIEIASDGSLLISDDQADLIYRVRRAGSD
jgi:glucose/arabinose dehydrogenase